MRFLRVFGFATLAWSAALPVDAAPTAEIAARETAERWLKVIDQFNYGEAWARCAPFFRVQINRESFIDGLTQVRTPLGDVRSRRLAKLTYTTTLPNAPDAHYVIVQYKTQFTGRDEPVLETLTPMLIDPAGEPVPIIDDPFTAEGTWQISGYYIQ